MTSAPPQSRGAGRAAFVLRAKGALGTNTLAFPFVTPPGLRAPVSIRVQALDLSADPDSLPPSRDRTLPSLGIHASLGLAKPPEPLDLPLPDGWLDMTFAGFQQAWQNGSGAEALRTWSASRRAGFSLDYDSAAQAWELTLPPNSSVRSGLLNPALALMGLADFSASPTLLNTSTAGARVVRGSAQPGKVTFRQLLMSNVLGLLAANDPDGLLDGFDWPRRSPSRPQDAGASDHDDDDDDALDPELARDADESAEAANDRQDAGDETFRPEDVDEPDDTLDDDDDDEEEFGDASEDPPDGDDGGSGAGSALPDAAALYQQAELVVQANEAALSAARLEFLHPADPAAYARPSASQVAFSEQHLLDAESPAGFLNEQLNAVLQQLNLRDGAVAASATSLQRGGRVKAPAGAFLRLDLSPRLRHLLGAPAPFVVVDLGKIARQAGGSLKLQLADLKAASEDPGASPAVQVQELFPLTLTAPGTRTNAFVTGLGLTALAGHFSAVGPPAAGQDIIVAAGSGRLRCLVFRNGKPLHFPVDVIANLVCTVQDADTQALL